ncbi:MAG: diguanylate cyclase [Chitinivibrionales bacterium]|nr:diguanylate cyclase [Chitinivibrionales bacterium]
MRERNPVLCHRAIWARQHRTRRCVWEVKIMRGRDRTERDGMPAKEQPLRPEELRAIEVLHDAPLEAIWGILEHCPLLTLSPGETLVDASARSPMMYLLVSGRLLAYQQDVGQESARVIEAGATLNEEAVLGGKQTPHTVIAAEPSRVLVVDDSAFWRLVGASHAFAANLLVRLAGCIAAGGSGGARLQPIVELDHTLDGLTGVNSRRWFDRTLPRLVGRYGRDRRPLSIIAMDIDRLQRVNEEYGQTEGDRVLKAVGRLLQWSLRPTDLSARVDGDRFCIVLPGTIGAGALAAAERLRGLVATGQFVTAQGVPISGVTVSAGVSELRTGQDADELLSAVQAALESAKKNGGNTVNTGG